MSCTAAPALARKGESSAVKGKRNKADASEQRRRTPLREGPNGRAPAVAAPPVPEPTAPAAAVRRPAGFTQRPRPANFGAIDVGTNSIHMVMAEISPQGDFRILGRDKELVQLGRGGMVGHVLTDEAMQSGLAALMRLTKMARLKGITKLRAVATSAVREAHNGGQFVEMVRDQVGIDLHVISAEEEARLVYLAVRHAVELGAEDSLLVDVGGGSVEFIVGNAEKATQMCSAKIGALRLAETFLRQDPPAMGEIKAMRRHIEQNLEPLVGRLSRARCARCVGTSASVETIATICAYRRGATEIEPITELRITRAELKSVIGELRGMNRAQRAKVPGIDTNRSDIVFPAAVLLHTILRTFDIDEMTYCDSALREGLILDHISRKRAGLLARAQWPDPRTRSVVYLAERCGYNREHSEQVARLTLVLFDELQTLHGLDPYHRELLRFGCLLHDVGYLISHKGHHKHSYYLIRNGGLQGFTEREVEIVANIARYHRKGRPKKSHYSWQNLSPEDRPAVRSLVALLRLANALDRTHFSVVSSLTCRIRNGRVNLLVHSDKDVELELWHARRQAAFFEKQFDCRLDIQPAEQEATPRRSHVRV